MPPTEPAAAAPVFSVLMPTRNRPALFASALESVLAQQGVALEVVVVDDGSSDEALAQYAALPALADPRVRVFHLLRTARGHGQAHVINHAATLSHGAYLGFLDDDDCWIDADHLARAGASIAASGAPVDLLYANQRLFLAGAQVDRVTWLEDLPSRLAGPALADGSFAVTAADLLRAHGFGHVNTTLIRRALFDRIGGFDPQIAYECDRDFYLRAIDVAEVVRYSPCYVARHNAPDQTLRVNMSTAEPVLARRLSQLRVLDKAIAMARRPEVQRHARRHKGFALKRIAEDFAGAGDISRAAFYAREALATGFGLKWAAFTALLSLRAAVQCSRNSASQ